MLFIRDTMISLISNFVLFAVLFTLFLKEHSNHTQGLILMIMVGLSFALFAYRILFRKR